MSGAVSHPVCQMVDDVLEKLLAIRNMSIPTGIEPILERADELFTALKVRLSIAHGSLVSNGVLNNLQTNVQSVLNCCNQALASNNPNVLPQMYGSLDGVAVYFSQIPVIESVQEAETIRDALVSLKRSLSQHASNLHQEQKRLQELLREVENEASVVHKLVESYDTKLDELDSRLNTIENENTQRFNEWKSEQEALLTEQRNQQTTRFENEIQETAHQVDLEIQDFRRMIEDTIAEQKRDVKAAIEESKKKLDDFFTEQISSAKAVLDELESLKQQAAEMVGVVATTGIAGGYQKVADSEEQRALWWRICAFASFVLLVCAAAVEWYVEFIHPNKEFNWSMFSGRLVVAGSILALATYAARQSSIHTKNAFYNRRMELILKSIDPYLESLDVSVRQKIKESLADSLFTHTEVPAPSESKEEYPLSADFVQKLIAAAAEKISK